MSKLYFLLFNLLLFNSLICQESKVKIVAAGDFMVHTGQIKAAQVKDNIFDFEKTFRYVENYIKSADISIVNLETVLAGKPYTGYPTFSSPDTIAKVIKNIGFDIVVTANNHCLDKGKKGLEQTINLLNKANLKTTGSFIDSIDKLNRNILFFKHNNIKFALLNYTYGTNGFRPTRPNLVNLIDTNEIKQTIKNCKKNNSEVIIIYFHWGNEYQRIPSKYQSEITKFCFENGVDIVIGSHPHVVQKYEFIKNYKNSGKSKVVAYSLGNFISNQYWRYSNGGVFLEINIIKDKNNNIDIKEPKYIPFYVYKYFTNKRNYVLIFTDKAEKLKNELKISDKEIKNIQQFEEDVKEIFK